MVFLTLKLAMLAWLVVIWSRVLRLEVTSPPWVLFLMLGYSSTIFVDVASGNVVVFEQLFLWLGIAHLLRQRYIGFVTMVVSAALFKLTPITLLTLCLWIPDRRRYGYLALGATIFAAIQGATYLVSPELTASFFSHVFSLDERGPNNAALLPLLRDVPQQLAQAGFNLPGNAASVSYAMVAGAILVVTGLAANRAFRSQETARIAEIAHIVLLGTAVAAPRMKLYAYIIVLAPTFYAAMTATRVPSSLLLLLLASLTLNNWMIRPEQSTLLWNYWSWLVATGAWLLLISRHLRPSRRVWESGFVPEPR